MKAVFLRTELNDLSSQHPDRVETMSKEWFRIAKDVERLKGKNIAPVGNKIQTARQKGSQAKQRDFHIKAITKSERFYNRFCLNMKAH